LGGFGGFAAVFAELAKLINMLFWKYGGQVGIWVSPAKMAKLMEMPKEQFIKWRGQGRTNPFATANGNVVFRQNSSTTCCFLLQT